MPSQLDIARVALRSLEDALAQAEHGPVQPQWWHRLALTCLLNAGIAEPWQCQSFWKEMAEPRRDTIPDHPTISGCRK